MKKLFIILSAIMLAIAFAVPAGAVDWDFYGSVRMQTFSSDRDENVTATTTDFDDRDSTWGLVTGSRIGATVKDGDIGGRFEYGHSGSDVTLRRLYGTWDFGVGELLLGQEYTPLHFTANQGYDNDRGLRDFGGLYTCKPMIQVKIDGFKLALVSPNTGDPENMVPTAGVLPAERAEYDTTYPKVEASYTLAMDTSSVRVFGGWNSFEAVNRLDREYDVTSYIYGVAGVVNVGPVTLKAMIWEGQNVGLYGLTIGTKTDLTPDYTAAVNDLRDNNAYGGIASMGVKINDVIGVEAGYGYIEGEDDPQGKNNNDKAWAVYLQAPITLAKGVMIIPEIGHYDYETDANSADGGYESYFGAKWMIGF